MHKKWYGPIIGAALLAVTCVGVNADDQKDEKDAAAEAAALEEAAKPGKEHQQLQRLVGSWKTKTTSYFPDPENPEVTEGSAKFTSLLGGRFVQQRFKGEFGGMKFNGIGISGFDNVKQKYVGVWLDDMGTGIMHTEGTYDPKTHTLSETGKFTTPGGEMQGKMVSQYHDPNSFTFTMSMVSPDGEVKLFEIAYTRDETGEQPKKKNKEATE